MNYPPSKTHRKRSTYQAPVGCLRARKRSAWGSEGGTTKRTQVAKRTAIAGTRLPGPDTPICEAQAEHSTNTLDILVLIDTKHFLIP